MKSRQQQPHSSYMKSKEWAIKWLKYYKRSRSWYAAAPKQIYESRALINGSMLS